MSADLSKLRRLSKFVKDNRTGYYKLANSTGNNIASLVVTGSIAHGVFLEKASFRNGIYTYHNRFSYVRPVMKDADVGIAVLNTLADSSFLTSAVLQEKYQKAGANIRNAHPAYLDALKWAGFDVLSLTGEHAYDLGPEGLQHTCDNIRSRDMICNGIGKEPITYLEVNNIRIAVVAMALDIESTPFQLEKSYDKMISIYSEKQIVRLMKTAKKNKAEYILVMLSGRSNEKFNSPNKRMVVGEKLAELGADCVVYNWKQILSTYKEYCTKDGRIVPIATSLSSLNGGIHAKTVSPYTALLKINLYKDQNGHLFPEYNYVPCKRYVQFENHKDVVVPVADCNAQIMQLEEYEDIVLEVEKRMEQVPPIDIERIVKMNSHFRNQITVKEICQVLDVEVPTVLEGKADEYVSIVVAKRDNVMKGCACFIRDFNPNEAQFYLDVFVGIDEAVEKGALIVIAERNYEELPTIVVANKVDAYIRLCAYIRKKYKTRSIAVTGTAGKTTTTELLSQVMARHKKTLRIFGNYNTYHSVGDIIQKLDDTTEYYIQETHEGTIGAAANVSHMMQPDAGLITNIGHGHIMQMGTFDVLVRETMRIAEGMRSDGVLFLNRDNQALAEQNPDVKVVWYSSYNPECDYYAKNIVEKEDCIQFQICNRDNYWNAVLNFTGVHNVNNAVGVFAVARHFGVPEYKIIAEMSRYKPKGQRQNAITIKDSSVIVDCYNANPLSMRAALDNLAKAKGKRKIAVLGDMAELGADSEKMHRQIGKYVVECGIDILYVTGKESLVIAEGAKEAGNDKVIVEHFEDKEKLVTALTSNAMCAGDTILVKASHSMEFIEIVRKLKAL